MLALAMYEATLCKGCGHPKQLAWHAATQGLWEGEQFVCLACTAAVGKEQVITHALLEVPPDAPIDLDRLPPLQLGVNTVEPAGRTAD